MSLSCECFDDYEWYYNSPHGYTTFKLMRRRRCCSCREQIELNAICLLFECYKMDEDDNEIPLADQYMCEECGDLFYSLEDLGFCLNLNENMHDLIQEYQEVYGESKA